MNTPWRTLLWKELCEQWAVALVLLIILLAVPPLISLTDLDSIYFGVSGTVMLAVPMIAVFIGMGIASGEHSRGTIDFLQALPVATSRPAAAKLIVGLLSLIVPVVLAVGVFTLWHEIAPRVISNPSRLTQMHGLVPRPWGIRHFFVGTGVTGILLSASLLIWTVAVGANRKDEISAGAWAIGVIVGIYAIVMIPLALLREKFGTVAYQTVDQIFDLILPAFPGGVAFGESQVFYLGSSWTGRFGLPLVVAILSHGLLIWAFLKRYGRVASSDSQSAVPTTTASQRGWLSAPRRTRFTAVAWKTWRELAPLLIVGVAITAGMVVLYSITGVRNIAGPGSDWRELVFAIWVMIGSFVAIALGIGTIREDLEPSLHTFWRSRPTSPDGWFWTKFCFAGVMLLLVGYVAAWLHAQHGYEVAEAAFVAEIGQEIPESAEAMYRRWAPAIGVVLVHLGLYIGGVLLMILVRRPVFAAVLDAGLMIGLGFLSEYVFRWIGPTDWNGLVIGIPLVMLCMLVAALLAWQAFKKNWSLERWLR
ncbi:ABC transporter permease [Adhaeretor mobilis]|uniref:ABC-2 family transporter protein n=1 Tax=Adhaeretor mobilis TaxID=1930276 RepID=A0A517MSI6_9BACT|nr:ABC transporter permease [Adhaeretor mobilis]QDS97844.1 ABC-2 family transporter protein [Adhaeretor mobilis]